MSDFTTSLTALMILLSAGACGCQSPGSRAGGYVVPNLPGRDSSEKLERKADATAPDPLALAPEGRGDQIQNRGGKNSASNVPCGCGSLGDTVSLSPGEMFRQDRGDFFPMLGRDAKGLVNWRDLAILGGSLAGSLAVREELDDDVRGYVDGHPQRWGNASENLGYLGEVQYQVPVLLGIYGYSLHSSDEELHSLSKSIISAYVITGLSTVAIKGVADTERPSREWNDGRFGFPSYHTASSFSIAAVVEEYEGAATALPIYALAGLIGWSRIDERDHDLSDVLFGAAMGYVIGKSVARQHRERESQWRLLPYSHPVEPAGGIGAELRF